MLGDVLERRLFGVPLQDEEDDADRLRHRWGNPTIWTAGRNLDRVDREEACGVYATRYCKDGALVRPGYWHTEAPQVSEDQEPPLLGACTDEPPSRVLNRPSDCRGRCHRLTTLQAGLRPVGGGGGAAAAPRAKGTTPPRTHKRRRREIPTRGHLRRNRSATRCWWRRSAAPTTRSGRCKSRSPMLPAGPPDGIETAQPRPPTPAGPASKETFDPETAEED